MTEPLGSIERQQFVDAWTRAQGCTVWECPNCHTKVQRQGFWDEGYPEFCRSIITRDMSRICGYRMVRVVAHTLTTGITCEAVSGD